jgi:hypothetical protein
LIVQACCPDGTRERHAVNLFNNGHHLKKIIERLLFLTLAEGSHKPSLNIPGQKNLSPP